ncbi:MAG: small acid-soluble spore protein SspI [Bacilli bacterium]|nr:small acid-soluble spore protein SspI [Bacilli bacterium]
MREALLNNLKGFNAQQLKETIDDGISSKEETILVGLGVLFEHYYKSLNESEKNSFLNSISSLL